jgi:peptide/nickel transport system substrate-binding protein
MVLTACDSGTSATPTSVPAPPTATTAAAVEQPTTAPEATTATTGTGGTTSEPATKGIMTISVAQQATWIRNFNPFTGDFRFPTINGVFEPMMIYNTVKGEMVPWLATKSEWSADNKKLTLTLRDDVKWSDGQPFTAKDVVFPSTCSRPSPACRVAAARRCSAIPPMSIP